MARLAAWSLDARRDDYSPRPLEPQRVPRSQIGLEKHLEDWIVKDVTLIGEGYTLVGRQVLIDDGRLDLLAIDAQDRWVVIEVKPGMLDSRALHQALYYASSLDRLAADELKRKLQDNLGQFGDRETLSGKVKQQLDDEGEQREVAVLLVGAGINPGLGRMHEFLARFGIPIGVVSFEVFSLKDGPQLLIREEVDEPAKPPAPRRRHTVEAIRELAGQVGVRQQFDRFVEMSRRAGLAVQPHKQAVRIAPPANRTRFLLYAAPRAGVNGGEMGISAGPTAFAEFFPHIGEEEARDALGKFRSDVSLGGAELEERLTQIESFLTEHFPQPG